MGEDVLELVEMNGLLLGEVEGLNVLFGCYGR